MSWRDEDGGALSAYLRGIGRLPRLTLVEERELGRRIQLDGDQAALTRLVEVRIVLPGVVDERGKELMREFGKLHGQAGR